ncbi:MAG: hypothetical protein K2P70_09410 [Hyphomonadaceae bacterium]|nr:hypothetical protein [Hyphomonadaceae bacterium]
MTAIPHAGMALTSALDRFEHAASQVLEAVTGASDDAKLAEGLVALSAAKTQVKASVALVRFSDEMYDALLEIGQEPKG